MNAGGAGALRMKLGVGSCGGGALGAGARIGGSAGALGAKERAGGRAGALGAGGRIGGSDEGASGRGLPTEGACVRGGGILSGGGGELDATATEGAASLGET